MTKSATSTFSGDKPRADLFDILSIIVSASLFTGFPFSHFFELSPILPRATDYLLCLTPPPHSVLQRAFTPAILARVVLTDGPGFLSLVDVHSILRDGAGLTDCYVHIAICMEIRGVLFFAKIGTYQSPKKIS